MQIRMMSTHFLNHIAAGEPSTFYSRSSSATVSTCGPGPEETGGKTATAKRVKLKHGYSSSESFFYKACRPFPQLKRHLAHCQFCDKTPFFLPL